MSIATQQNLFDNKALDSEKFDKSFPTSKSPNKGLASSYSEKNPYNTEKTNLENVGNVLYGKKNNFQPAKSFHVIDVISKNSSGVVKHGGLYKTDITGFQAKVNEMLADVDAKKK